VELAGLSVAEAAGRPFVQEILCEEDRQWAAACLHDAATGKVSGPHETVWRVAGGYSRNIGWTVRPLSGPNGDIQYLIVSGQDITEQRKAEEALVTSESRYRQVVESSLGFVFTCNLEGRLTSLNAFTAETLGYRMEDLIGRSVTELLDSGGAASFRDCLRALDSKDEWQGAIPVRRRDGIFRHIAFRSRRVELRGERPFLLHHGVDITEQHDAEEALQLATRQHELILESVGDGIYGIDLESRLTFINPAGTRALGYRPEELSGRDILEVIHHSHADGTPYSRLTSPILQSMQKGQSIRMSDEVFWRADGTAIPVEYTASPLIEDGLISGMVVAFQDISERRRLEKMKDEFISTVSHELRTPLTSLRASLGLLSAGAMQKYPEKQRQMIEMAIGNCDRLVRLVNDIVDFDRGQRGRMALRRVPVSAVDLLRRAVDVAQPAATEAKIGFRMEAQTEFVLADEDRALQVLNELVANAIKFSPPSTLIRLSALPSGDADVHFMVEDQGPGIEPEKLQRIFDRFEQGDASDTRALGGTGLGLALCRSIVEQHGGRMWAERAPGRGSRLYFTLPRATKDPE
jgi:PAS domain S-box-containing protein